MEKSIELRQKLKNLPNCPGVYFHKDKTGEIIYVGKAASLRNRVRQYFQSSKLMDSKTLALVSEIDDTDWVETDSEMDALFLEAEMVKRYMPRYNILLRDDKSSIYIRIDMNNDWPHVSFVHMPIDDKAEYFGPYFNAYSVKKALRYLRKIFPYFINAPRINSGKASRDLDTHLGLAPIGISSNEYKANLRKMIRYIKGDRSKILNDLEKDMAAAAAENNFELAAKIRNQIFNLRDLRKRIVFGDKEFLDIDKDRALNDLMELFNLTQIPIRIEGFDISHMSGTNVVSSMVVFKNGVSDRANYRKFKLSREKNDDFYNMNETLMRRFSDKNIKDWGVPNLVLIDGGKGQLDAALKIRDKNNLKMPFIGLAKKQEQIVIFNQITNVNFQKLNELSGFLEESDNFTLINLPINSPIIKLFQRIRDESHRFAVSYHTVLKRARQTTSALDEIPGIGPKTKVKLMKKFGSLSAIKKASLEDLESLVGKRKSKLVKKYIVDEVL